jgi:hypothetical protein
MTSRTIRQCLTSVLFISTILVLNASRLITLIWVVSRLSATPTTLWTMTPPHVSCLPHCSCARVSEWFAVADNLLNHEPAVFINDKYTEYGKWMDGWESRRKRIAGKWGDMPSPPLPQGPSFNPLSPLRACSS